jgi:REP element-mobilizing transposase RayT
MRLGASGAVKKNCVATGSDFAHAALRRAAILTKPSFLIGFIKGKSSIWIAQNIERKAKNFTGHKFWARGYFVSTVGRDMA